LDAIGFVAATWFRGVAYWNVPTTLTAQVDAALGGKTAINFGGVKNQIGVVRQPERVLVDPSLLSTTSDDDYRSGLGEVAKTALLAGGALDALVRDEAAALLRRDLTTLGAVAAACLRFKARIVAADPDETEGSREILNAGHTIGHALEAYAASIGRPSPHGLHVAAGLALEARVLSGSDVAAIDATLDALGLPKTPASRPPLDVARVLLGADKKRRSDGLVSLPRIAAPGRVDRVALDVETLARAAAGLV
jgi:3-dehydroquinate synthetase